MRERRAIDVPVIASILGSMQMQVGAGLLASPMLLQPSHLPGADSDMNETKAIIWWYPARSYSSEDCTGFSPDSLFSQHATGVKATSTSPKAREFKGNFQLLLRRFEGKLLK